MTYQKRRRPRSPKQTPEEIERQRQLDLYHAAIESAEASGGSILDVDPTEFGLPEDMDDGERYFAHAMSKDD